MKDALFDRSRIALRLLWLPLLLVVPLAGCVSPDLLDPSSKGEEDGAGVSQGYAQVQVYLRALGAPQFNVSMIEMSFSQVALYESVSGQWVHVPARSYLELQLDDPDEVPMAPLTLPTGRYTELWARLDHAALVVDGERLEAVAAPVRCHVQLAMELEWDPAGSSLVLYFWIKDAVGYEGGWVVKPAFSGSMVRPQAEDGSAGLGEHGIDGVLPAGAAEGGTGGNGGNRGNGSNGGNGMNGGNGNNGGDAVRFMEPRCDEAF